MMDPPRSLTCIFSTAKGLRTCQGVARRAKTGDVLGQAFEVLALMGLDAVAAMHVEAGMHPAAQHPGAFGREESLFAQEGDDARPK